MKYLLIFLLITSASLVPGILKADTKLDFATVDILTYRLYLEKKWDSVIMIGKQALRQDIDYYYLRARMGIAYFEKSEYFRATTHLKKARQFNSEDPVIADYLYYAYLYTNRTGEARIIRSSKPHNTQQVNGLQQGAFIRGDEVHAEAGYTFSSDRSPDNLATLMEKDSIYGEQDLYGNNFYSNLSLKLEASDRVVFRAAYNYLNFAKTKYIQYGKTEAVLDSIIDNTFSNDYSYSFPWAIHDTSFSYKIVQHEGYFNASVMLPHEIKITGAVHMVHVSYPVIGIAMTDSASDTAYYLKADSTYHLFSYPSVAYVFTFKDTSFTNWVISMGLSKDFGIFNLGLSGSWSNLNNKKQGQIGASLTYYPLGNLNFYGTTAMTGFFQKRDNRLLISQVLGAKVTPWMWGEANFYYGNYTNANIYDGSIVYNNSDIIDYRAGASLMFMAGSHLRFSLIFQYSRKESIQLYYIKAQDPVTHEINEIPQTKNNPYHTNTLIGGITWKL